MQNNFKYIDIHSHLNFSAYDKDRDEVIKRTKEAGVVVVNVGTQKDTSCSAVDLAEKNENMYATVGLHPVHTSKSFHDKDELGDGGKEFTSREEIFDVSYYRELVKNSKVVAIGECGLDYFRIKNGELGIMYDEVKKRQEDVFRAQIELAVEFNKPLMLHIRNGEGKSAYNESFSILKSYNFNLKSVPGNLHFFAGSVAEAKPFLDAGFYFSFTGVITFARNYDEVIKYIPEDRIMSETDSPYVAPASYRGKRNEPIYVKEVVKALASIRGDDEEKMREMLLENAKRFFNLK